MAKNMLRNVVTFLAIFLVVNMIFSKFMGNPAPSAADTANPIKITTSKTEYGRNALVGVTIENNTDKDIVLGNDCPSEPLDVYSYKNNQWQQIQAKTDMVCPSDVKNLTIAAKNKLAVDYGSWNHALFADNGRYKISFKTVDPVDGKTAKVIESNEFTVVDASIFRTAWTTLFYQPIYNVLIFLTVKIPYHDLGFAIILLTILIRLILLAPSQKALKSQKKMQELQPKLDALKEKHKGNQQAISAETMALWKEHKVNPFGSCLPLLIQFPVLIALFYVVQTGLNPDNAYLLYPGFVSVVFGDIHTLFLGALELTKKNVYVLPLIVGLLQFVQMKMTLKKANTGGKKSEMEMANSMMIYIMPVMIALFTASTPSGVGLYWATSTLFGIGQQWYVNKQSDQKNDNNPKKIIVV